MESTRNSKTTPDEEGLASLKRDLQNAKLFLQQSSGASGDSLFDHLSNVIAKVIDERPKNVVDYFEQFSERVRLESFRMSEHPLEDAYKEPERLSLANKRLPVLIAKSKQPSTVAEDDEDANDDVDEEKEEELIYRGSPSRDLCELQFYWNLLGIGFPHEEVFSLACSMARLQANPAIASCRFWGKMLGLSGDYYVIECALAESALEERIDAVEKAINITSLEFPAPVAAAPKNNDDDDDDKNNGSDLREEVRQSPAGWNFSSTVPESQYRSPVEIPAESPGRGVNRMVYFVCTDLMADEWIELPPATPHQINVSRRVTKYLTADLDHDVASFPGTERVYLRALIARISAGTSISPRNFYQIGSESDDDESDDDDDASLTDNDKPIVANAAYSAWPTSKLLQLDYWEHHKPEILKQGRVGYFDGNSLTKTDDDDESDASSDVEQEDGDGTEAANNKTKPEIPIPLFASLSGDRLTNEALSISPWTIRLSDVVETLVSAQSHVWPGAFAFVKDRICDNIYIGYGNKNSPTVCSLPAPPSAEYPFGPDVIEGEEPMIELTKNAASPNDPKASDGDDDAENQ